MIEYRSIILGATLAILGGVLGYEYRAWRERSQERNALKVAISDELSEIETTTAGIHTVWDSAAKVIDPKLVTDLLTSTTVYDGLRTRLFLISDDKLRKELATFYKKVKDTVRKTEGKIGALELTPEEANEQAAFDTAFQALGTEAGQLKAKLEK